jgi:hypothetical protein
VYAKVNFIGKIIARALFRFIQVRDAAEHIYGNSLPARPARHLCARLKKAKGATNCPSINVLAGSNRSPLAGRHFKLTQGAAMAAFDESVSPADRPA